VRFQACHSTAFLVNIYLLMGRYKASNSLLYLCGLFCSQVRFSEDIGEIYKVRLGFDDDIDAEQNWLLDTVKDNLNSNCF